ncbi:hypothetical protein LINGRAHAP2_LOCUS14805 [Linum grandiflorum]
MGSGGGAATTVFGGGGGVVGGGGVRHRWKTLRLSAEKRREEIDRSIMASGLRFFLDKIRVFAATMLISLISRELPSSAIASRSAAAAAAIGIPHVSAAAAVAPHSDGGVSRRFLLSLRRLLHKAAATP